MEIVRSRPSRPLTAERADRRAADLSPVGFAEIARPRYVRERLLR